MKNMQHNISGAWLLTLLTAGCITLAGCDASKQSADPAPAAIPLTSDGKPNFSGVWRSVTPIAELRTVDGQSPPLLDAAAKILAARKLDGSWDGTRKCKPPGEPRIMSFEQRPFEIGQRPDRITFMYEWNRLVRSLPITTEQLKFTGPYYFGQSQAHWDGEVLVVDVQGVNEDTALDDSGLPHSDTINLTERFRLIDGGARMEALIDVQDPLTFSKPWQTRLVFERQKDRRIQEDWCIERLGLQNTYPSLPEKDL